MNKKWLIVILILVLVCAAIVGVILYRNADGADNAPQPEQTAQPAEDIPTLAPEETEIPESTPEPTEPPEEDAGRNADDESELGDVEVTEEYVIELGDGYAVAGG